jgi:hypothetical protein
MNEGENYSSNTDDKPEEGNAESGSDRHSTGRFLSRCSIAAETQLSVIGIKINAR